MRPDLTVLVDQYDNDRATFDATAKSAWENNPTPWTVKGSVGWCSKLQRALEADVDRVRASLALE